eukprot:c6075_g1_i1.p1 GENE.c6075_g1_i1~~c6075_g1_i1.p1  ORF type:complete len:231 (+),score=20.55 c6075_g1_i1:31-693(+)
MDVSNLKLYTFPNNARAFKALIPAQYGGLAIDVVGVEMGVTNKTTEFLALNPRGLIPTLSTPEGGIFESNAIARYVARVAGGHLLGASAYEGTKQAKADFTRVLGLLNEYLATRTFLVADRVTLADVVVAMTLLDLYKVVFDPAFRRDFVNTNRWFSTIVNQPNVVAVIGEFALCTKMAAYNAAEAVANAAAAKAAALPKETRSRKEAAPKENAAAEPST